MLRPQRQSSPEKDLVPCARWENRSHCFNLGGFHIKIWISGIWKVEGKELPLEKTRVEHELTGSFPRE